MRETIKRLLREEGQKKDTIEKALFKYWDKNGPSIETGKYFSLSDYDTAEYLIKYHGDNVEELVTDEVKNRIENYHSCNGDEFNLRFDNISFEWTGLKNTVGYTSYSITGWSLSYNVSFSIDYDSTVFQNEFDFEDHENLMTLYGQTEECVENMLNNTVYDTYGIPVHYCMLNGVYDSNI